MALALCRRSRFIGVSQHSAALLRTLEVIQMNVSICLLRALSDTRGFDATDSRDKIFALLRLSQTACDYSLPSRSVKRYAQHVNS